MIELPKRKAPIYKEIEEFKMKNLDVKDFLENLTSCWEEKIK